MSVCGTWDVIYTSQLGEKRSWWRFEESGSQLVGSGSGEDDDGRITTFEKAKVIGEQFEFEMQLTPKVRLRLSGTVSGDTISGKGRIGLFKAGSFVGARRRD